MAIIDITNTFIQKIIGYEELKAILCIRGKLVEIKMITALEIYLKYITINKKG